MLAFENDRARNYREFRLELGVLLTFGDAGLKSYSDSASQRAVAIDCGTGLKNDQQIEILRTRPGVPSIGVTTGRKGVKRPIKTAGLIESRPARYTERLADAGTKHR